MILDAHRIFQSNALMTQVPGERGGFVCAMNRDRDDYQLALGLHEAGLLTRLVTDFYAADQPSRWLPGRLRKRRAEGLPAALATSTPAAFVLQTGAELARLPLDRIWPTVDAMLARKTATVARRAHAHLYCYSPYLPSDHLISPGVKKVIFEFHPLPKLLWELLTEDHARYPQVAWSYALEGEVLARAADHDVWRRADAVACASAITRRSLIHAGCDPDLITVIPYGFDPVVTDGGQSGHGANATTEFLFVGQGVQRKGLHHLIEAWQQANLADARLTLVCYRIDPGIRAMIDSPSIRLLARQSDAELDALYNEADVFVMPSLIEGFGLVYLEALARGCHVIGTENTGLPDLNLPSDAATILPAGEIAVLSDALTRARDRQRVSGYDRRAIQAAAMQWRWADFRDAIGAHARSLLAV